MTFSVLFYATLAFGQHSFEVPNLNSPVVDQVGLLSASQKNEIESLLYNFKQNHNAQIQVLIVPDLKGEAIEQAAIKVFDQWKLGDEKRDDGILMLFAMNEKKMRIEVGQGLEGSVPDVIAKRIIADVIRPYFQRGEYYSGIKIGAQAVQSAILEDPAVTQQQVAKESRKKKRGGGLDLTVIIGIFIVWLIIFIISPSTGINILLLALSRGGRSSGGSGGSWGGGGGRSSGGGASGGW